WLDSSDASVVGVDWAPADFSCGPCRVIHASAASPDGSMLRLSWSGDLPLTLWAGDSWGATRAGFSVVATGMSPIAVRIPSHADTVLVGLDAKTVPRHNPQTVPFTLAVELP